MSVALSGLRSATSQFSTAASGIVAGTARPPAAGGNDLPAQFVAMSQARAAFGADIVVLKAADGMAKSLLDILA